MNESPVLVLYNSAGTEIGTITNPVVVSAYLAAAQPGDDAANDRKNVKIVEIGVFTPPATTGTTVDDSATNTVLPSTVALAYTNWTATIKNAGGGGGNAIDSITVQQSPDGIQWNDIWTRTGLALASGSSWNYSVSGNSYNYIRVNALCTSGQTTTADAWFTGNKG
jgi:hypothetical protein